MTKDQIIHRDAFTGQIVTVEYAAANPDTTVRETRKARKWRRRAEAAEAKLDAVREWLDARGVNVDDRDDDYMRGYRDAQRHALLDARELRATLDGTEPR